MPESPHENSGTKHEEGRTREARQRAQMRRPMDVITDGLCVLGEDRALLMGNDAGYELLQSLAPGAQPGQVLSTLAGQPLAEFLDGESHIVEFDGPPLRQLTVTAHAVQDEEGERGWVLMLRDETERQRFAELSRQQERLAAVGQLAAGIAHDFNNILSSILLYAQLLGGEPQLTQGGQRRLQVIQEQTKRASELVRQILDFSRRSVMQRSDVEMVHFCQELVDGWRRTLAANIDVSLRHSAERYVVSADGARLHQALLNLALNAQEAMPHGGSLALALTHRHLEPADTVPHLGMEPGYWLQLTVVDTGTGIPAEALPHVFEPFFSTKPLHEGAGLGLAQVYGIVQQHGGHIKVDSEPQKGTVVTIFLPLKEVPSGPGQDAAMPGKKTVLIVEENGDLREALRETLADPAYRMALTATGKEAMDVVQRHELKPDLIVGDLAMPQMSGIALLQAVRKYNAHCRMIIVSSYPRPADISRLRQQGIVDWLSKPLSLGELLERVKEVLEEG